MYKTKLTSETREKLVAEDIFLNYLNKYLYEHGAITDKEYNAITAMIAQRKGNQLLK